MSAAVDHPKSNPPAPRRFRWLWRSIFVSTLAAAFSLAWATYAYQTHVVEEPGPELVRAHVMSIIAQESPVLYRDGRTRLGVFFDQEHRSYLSFAELPRDYVNAIVAAEDGNFWQHPGVDPKHIFRAAWQNLNAGKVVAGGSTLTQQTAKNLFYRPDRSLRSKWGELVNALRLEAHYSKEEILEFYANQFHVSANGRGLAIAARYFFDKTVRELTLKECAFLAGLVKAPSRYNPFLGESEERRNAAEAAANDRTAYVLGRMLDDAYIDRGTYNSVMATPLVFKRGTFQYDRSVVLDAVQAQLEGEPFLELFSRQGIDNPSTAGIQIVTTLDVAAQAGATYALWHHLTEIGPIIERSGARALLMPERSVMPMEPGVPLAPRAFYLARVRGVGETITLDVGGRPCLVDEAGITRIVEVVARSRTGDPRAPADAAARQSVVDTLGVGGLVLVSVRPGVIGDARCDLELRPTMQGAVVALERGEVRALVGGNDNRNFDRASRALRQFGSTWKPLVYLAALQLGWLPTDMLDNRRNAFYFRQTWYYPRPDHPSESFVSMSLAGARSENLASVWLLAHLTDRLDVDAFRALMDQVGLGPAPGEDTASYGRRLRDTEDIRSSPDRFEEYAFAVAKERLLARAATLPHPEDAAALRSLSHGYGGIAAERSRLSRGGSAADRELKLKILGRNLLELEAAAVRCEEEIGRRFVDPVSRKVACGRAPAGYIPAADAVLLPRLPKAPPQAGSTAWWHPAPETPEAPPSPPDPEDWLVEGELHRSTLRELRAEVDRETAALTGRDPWDPSVVALNPDLRILVGIKAVVELLRTFGVETDVPEVLSLPLGAADLSLVDVATTYQGMLDGKRWTAPGEGFAEGAVSGLRVGFDLPPPPSSVLLIAEIRDAGGNVVYRARPQGEQVLDPLAGEMTGDILRNVVDLGTGRRALGALTVGGQSVPLFGKTGTTNDYRNAAFVGFAPTVGATRWGDAWTLAAYVGYDDNRPMKRGKLRVQGANGALPIWLGLAQALADAGVVGPALLEPSEGLRAAAVMDGTGVPRDESPGGARTLTLAGDPPARHFGLLRPAPATVPLPADPPAPQAEPVLPVEVLDPEEGAPEGPPAPAG